MNLLGITDLTIRWNYTRQGIHQKMKNDSDFPKPVAVINKNRTLVFTEDDITNYENNHKELTNAKYKKWFTHKKHSAKS